MTALDHCFQKVTILVCHPWNRGVESMMLLHSRLDNCNTGDSSTVFYRISDYIFLHYTLCEYWHSHLKGMENILDL